MQKRRCHYCGKLFVPDARVGNRQKACSKGCQRLRNKDNNRAFSKNNPEYWHGRYKYVKGWRQGNPDHQRRWRQKKKEVLNSTEAVEIQAEMGIKILINQIVTGTL